MSVRVGDRTESKLKVLDSARKLKKYTIDKIKDFPKSTRWLYAIPMSNCVRQACSSIRRANSVNVKMESDYMKRRNYQLDAEHGHTYHQRKRMIAYYRTQEKSNG